MREAIEYFGWFCAFAAVGAVLLGSVVVCGMGMWRDETEDL